MTSSSDPFGANDPIVKLNSEQEYIDMKERLDRHEAWVAAHAWGGKNGKKWLSYEPESVPLDCRINNRERDAIAEYEFRTQSPKPNVIYLRYEGAKYGAVTYRPSSYGRFDAGTFMGLSLGNGQFKLASWSPVGGSFYPVIVYGTNGTVYYGRFFWKSGDACVIRPMKNQERARIEYRHLKPE